MSAHCGPWTRRYGREPADVYCGRPSEWGNPFQIGIDGDREQVIDKFAAWFAKNEDLRRHAIRTLAGKTLACHCAPLACHADVLAAVANDPKADGREPVLVFGSNLAGRHGRGAALFAAKWRGAQAGVGKGLRGDSYALPTKDASLNPLHLDRIAEYVAEFIEFASANPQTRFDVTRVGCGLAANRDEDVAPLFFHVPPNCRLPWRWERLRNNQAPPRVILAGSRTIQASQFSPSKIDALLGSLPVAPVIVSGGARGVDQLGERYAIDRGLEFLRIPAKWTHYRGKPAGMIRNQHMSFMASHLIAVWDGRSPGTRGMIDIARADGLDVRVIRIGQDINKG